MKVTAYNPNPVSLPGSVSGSKSEPSGEELQAQQQAQDANALALQAINQLHFAGDNEAYLTNAKYLAELAGKQASGIKLSPALYAAKGANLSALQALSQAEKIEAEKAHKLNLVA